MILSRKGNKASARSHLNFSNIESYLLFILNLYSSIEIQRDKWLTDKEKDFYICCIMIYLFSDKNPNSEESRQIYKNLFSNKVTVKEISLYITKIVKKGWLRYNKKTKQFDIPQIFKNVDNDNDTFDFNIRFSYETPRHNK